MGGDKTGSIGGTLIGEVMIDNTKFACKMIENKKLQNAFVVFFAIMLVWLVGRNIPYLCTVLELGDEAGYLGNAAYFTGYDWNDIRTILPYYGYGYSVLLIPAFLITDTGVQLIQGACIVNLICVLGIYILQIFVMEKICVQINRIILSFASFSVCLYSYIVSNALKVDSETFLTFWYVLLAVLIYCAVKTDKAWAYGLLGAGCAYIFFIHTRAFIVIGAVFCVLVLLCIKYQISFFRKNFLAMSGVFLILFLGLYAVKLRVIHSAMDADVLELLSQDVDSSVNMITFSFVTSKIKALFVPENLKMYVLDFLAKVFYLIVGSGTMIVFGYSSFFKDIWRKWTAKEKSDKAAYAVELYLFLGATLTFLMCVFSGVGGTESFTLHFYGRYYEFIVPPVILYGMYSCIYEKQSGKKIFCIMAGTVISGIAASRIIEYIDNGKIYVDTCRVPEFTSIINRNGDYVSMILYAILMLGLFLALYLLIHQKKWSGLIIALLVFLMIRKNGCESMDFILDSHINGGKDAQVAAYIEENRTEQYIYVVEEPFRYFGFYARMQVLIKNERLHIILPEQLEDLEDGAYVITYRNTAVAQSFEEDKLLYEGNTFMLFEK